MYAIDMALNVLGGRQLDRLPLFGGVSPTLPLAMDFLTVVSVTEVPYFLFTVTQIALADLYSVCVLGSFLLCAHSRVHSL